MKTYDAVAAFLAGEIDTLEPRTLDILMSQLTHAVREAAAAKQGKRAQSLREALARILPFFLQPNERSSRRELRAALNASRALNARSKATPYPHPVGSSHGGTVSGCADSRTPHSCKENTECRE